LRLPSAIGALLDMARHHPEMPAELVSRALSACSVDCPNVGAGMSESELHRISGEAAFTGEITSLEPLAAVGDLEASSDDPCFAELLLQLKSESIEARVDAARSLGDYRVSSAVTALVEIASCDAESGVRAAAIASLAAIDHHSVFVSIVVALVDESREVRAAAARSLSILSLNRADAYARIAAHADQKTVRDVALACIKSGIAKQAVDRLCGGDRWQSYEAFATLAVLASANEFALIFETVEQHPDQNVAIAAARVLGVAGRSEALPGLRQLAVRDSISETLRTVVLEVIYKIDQSQPV
jgi:HEAT repeat protein